MTKAAKPDGASSTKPPESVPQPELAMTSHVEAMAPAANGWLTMEEAPHDRPVFLTGDPDHDSAGLLCLWRTTRVKNKPPLRGWSPRSYWAAVLTKREIEFEPICWREALAEDAVAMRELA